MPTETEKAYTAGVIDSDGWITIGRNFGIRLGVQQKTPQLCRWLLSIWEGSHLTGPYLRKNGRISFVWNTNGILAVGCLKEILPFLILKKDEAQLAIEFLNFKGGFPPIYRGRSGRGPRPARYWKGAKKFRLAMSKLKDRNQEFLVETLNLPQKFLKQQLRLF